MREPTHAYIGIAPCGCVQAIATDIPATRPDVKKMLNWGTVERVPLSEKPAMRLCFEKHKKNGCPHPGACPAATVNAEKIAAQEAARATGPDTRGG